MTENEISCHAKLLCTSCRYITKLGEVNKNWKRRYFVACEEAQNFVIHYYKQDGDYVPSVVHGGAAAAAGVNGGGSRPADPKAKGTIYPCGYIVKSVDNPEDKKLYGDYSICLQPVDKKRSWYLRYETRQLYKC
jgi:hypothetical protein